MSMLELIRIKQVLTRNPTMPRDEIDNPSLRFVEGEAWTLDGDSQQRRMVYQSRFTGAHYMLYESRKMTNMGWQFDVPTVRLVDRKGDPDVSTYWATIA